MFTGIIQKLGKILERWEEPPSMKIWVETDFAGIELGESIAVNGSCLTVSEIRGDTQALFHISEETLNKTNLIKIQIGDSLNLERAARYDGRVSGHIVQGHVDGRARVINIDSRSGGRHLKLRLPDDVARYCVGKGSIAVNGVSLTLNQVQDADVGITLIPYTWDHTNLSLLREGDEVNIEVDVLAKYVEKLCQPYLKPSPI